MHCSLTDTDRTPFPGCMFWIFLCSCFLFYFSNKKRVKRRIWLKFLQKYLCMKFCRCFHFSNLQFPWNIHKENLQNRLLFFNSKSKAHWAGPFHRKTFPGWDFHLTTCSKFPTLSSGEEWVEDLLVKFPRHFPSANSISSRRRQ